LRSIFRCALLLAFLLLGACKSSHTAYALTSTGTILRFGTNTPGTIDHSATVSGLSSGVSLVQIGYRPDDAQLYGVTSDNGLATVDPDSGAVTPVSGSAFSSDSLSGAAVSFDPVHDQLRLVTTEYNLRVNPDGTLADTATKLAFASGDGNSGKTPQVAAIAYDNAVSGASSTTLYALDVTSHELLRIGDAGTNSVSSVDDGLLHSIGSTGVSFVADAGFSIRSDNSAYAVLQQSGSGAALYTLDLGSGAASEVGSIGDGSQTIISLAMPAGD
jgi:hypothetical protein